MLVKFHPDQITKHWGLIEFGIKNSLPPIAEESPEKMNNILMALMDGRLDCWISTSSADQRIEAVCITQVLEDDASETKSLLLYCLYGFDEVDEGSWFEAFTTVSKYAKSLGCFRIICYTDVDFVIDKAKEFGGEMTTFVSFPI